MDELIYELMDEYKAKFGDIFPRMMMMSAPDEEVVAAIRQCLDTGQPFDPGLPDDAIV